MEHADKVIDLYDDEKHRHVADLLNQDPKTIAGVCGSISTWMLGYPDRALLVRMSQRGIMCWMVAHSNFLVGGVPSTTPSTRSSWMIADPHPIFGARSIISIRATRQPR